VTDELHLAEDVLAGHPDRLADGIAERIVTEALAVDPLALVGVEVAVHRRKVFVTGRVAAGGRPGVFGRLAPNALTDWVRWVYQRAGYGNEWGFGCAHDVQVVTDLDLGPLPAVEAGIRRFSDDQNIVAGHATGTAATAYLPPAPYIARRFRQALDRARGRAPDRLGPDGKVLVHLEEEAGRLRWRGCNAAVHHMAAVSTEELHDLVVPELAAEATALERDLAGVGATFEPELVRLNGIGDFTCGGPMGDNGLSGKKLVVDHYGPGVPIGGGALCGKDPHKVDRAGALAARQLAVRLVAGGHGRSATVWLGWFPGRETPDVVAARVDGAWWDAARLAASMPIPDLSVEGIAARLELASVRWNDVAAAGYFGNPAWSWER
jgi:S-adenosylmethionine synthetase